MTDLAPPAVRWINLRRGAGRLGVSLVAMWFVFWNFAYAMHSYSSIRPEPATFTIRISAWSVAVPCLVAILAFGTWVAIGFRSTDTRP